MADIFEEYRLHLERAEKLSERRQMTSQIYLTIATAIFGAVAFVVKDSGLHDWPLAMVTLPLFTVGIIACIIWLGIMRKIEVFLDWQYDRLREMEEKIPGSSKILNEENKRFYEPVKGGRKRFSFSLQEAWLPGLLIILFILYAAAIIANTYFHWL